MRHEPWFVNSGGEARLQESGMTAGGTGFWSYGVCKELDYPIESTNTPRKVQ